MLKILLLILLLFSTQVIAKINKKDSLNQTEEIVEKEVMFNAGAWYLFMQHCEGTYTKTWRIKLAKLSWPDFKNFGRGGAQYDSDYKVTKCDRKTVDDIKSWYQEIIDYIEFEVTGNKTSSKNKDNSKSTKKEDETKDKQDDSVEKKLKKLKSLYDQDLITKEEYDAKRKEILDEM